MSFELYEPNGKYNPVVFAIVPGLGLAGGVIGGWIYQTLIDLIPYIILGALFTLIFGVLLGVLVGFGLKWGKCRNRMLAIALGASVGVVGLGFSYFWAYQAVKSDVMADPELREEAGGQFGFGDYVGARVSYGWRVTGRHGGGGTSWSGGFVYMIWLVEAAIVIGMSAAAPLVFASKPFCEECDCWATEEKLGEVHGIDNNRIQAAVAGGDWQGLVQPIGDPQSNRWLEYTLYSCPAEGHAMWLSVDLKWETTKRKKDNDVDSEELVEYGLVDPQLVMLARQSVQRGPRMAEKHAKARANLPRGKRTPKTPNQPGAAPQRAPRPGAAPRKPGAPRPPLPRKRPPQS
jgi:hypothetical protein